MSVPRCVPWASWPEWDSVRVALFGGDPQAQRWALGVVREQRKREANVRHSTSLDFFFLPPPPFSQPRHPSSFFFFPPKTKKKQVTAWRSRGRRPLGVDATAAFVEAEIE